MAYTKTYLTEFIGILLLETNSKVLKKKQKVQLKLSTTGIAVKARVKQMGEEDDVLLGDLLYTLLEDGIVLYINKIKIDLTKERFVFNFKIKKSITEMEGYLSFAGLGLFNAEFNY